MELNYRNGGFRVGDAFVCSRALRRMVALPRYCRTIHAVFTKTRTKRLSEDSFTIAKPRLGLSWKATIEEYSGMLAYNTMLLLAKKYKAGFRFVHFEY